MIPEIQEFVEVSSSKEEDKIDVWLIKINDFQKWFPKVKTKKICSSPELQRAKQFLDKQDRERFLQRRAWVRIILSHYLKIKPPKIQWQINDHGKLEPNKSDLTCNWSTSGELMLLVVGKQSIGQLGIDLEKIRIDFDYQLLVETHCTPNEKKYLKYLQERKNNESCRSAFFHIWTGKEAYLKAIGTGLGGQLALKNIEFPLESFENEKWLELNHMVMVGKTEWSLPWYRCPPIILDEDEYRASLAVLRDGQQTKDKAVEVQFITLIQSVWSEPILEN